MHSSQCITLSNFDKLTVSNEDNNTLGDTDPRETVRLFIIMMISHQTPHIYI